MTLTSLHSRLRIPKDYSIFEGGERFAPEITQRQRGAAIGQLIGAGIVLRENEDVTLDLLEAMVRRLAAACPKNDFTTAKPKYKFGHGPLRIRAREEILRDPTATTKEIMRRANVSRSTVEEVRKNLREEGRT